MVYLALSCLQGRMAREAVCDLTKLEPEGIQLTPGNIPEEDFKDWFDAQNIPFMTHHGFDWEYRKRRVWNRSEGSYSCEALEGASVHPPINPDIGEDWMMSGRVLEVMYGAYGLGNENDVRLAMSLGVPLAVDVSHVYIQLEQETMSPKVWKHLQEYDNIVEVHVSANNGRHDTHQPLTADSFGLAWAREKAKAGTPLVLECYMHKLSESDRLQQMEMFR